MANSSRSVGLLFFKAIEILCDDYSTGWKSAYTTRFYNSVEPIALFVASVWTFHYALNIAWEIWWTGAEQKNFVFCTNESSYS